MCDARTSPRVVMLVDNDVRRDSRVQKTALSMADRGWEVFLLGTLPRGQRNIPARWRIGEARVRLIKVLARPRARRQLRAWLQNPLAYPTLRHARHREARVAGARADLLARRLGEAAQIGAGPVARTIHRVKWLPRRATNVLSAAWVARRSSLTKPRPRGGRVSVRSTRRREGAVPVWGLRWRHLLFRTPSWRRFDPHLLSLESAFGPVIDDLDPDLIHANDFRMLGPGARAKIRAAARGRAVSLVWDVHEYLPGVKPWSARPLWKEAQVAHEREYARYADEVVTVSEELGELLMKDHGLAREPSVVLNCPLASEAQIRENHPSVRDACGVSDSTPIMVYSGAAAPQRGLDTMIEAMPQLGGIVCALVVARPESPYVQALLTRARMLGVADRLRLLPYVPPDQVVGYLTSADVGVIPIQHFPNHEIALITKFFEYTHARLPIVVSDVRAMAAQVRETGQGEVFRADDVEDFIRAVKGVLADPQRYRDALEALNLEQHWTWEEQAGILDTVYRRALSKN